MTKALTTRMLKAFCSSCGYTIRISRKWADAGLPDCPCCSIKLEMDK